MLLLSMAIWPHPGLSWLIKFRLYNYSVNYGPNISWLHCYSVHCYTIYYAHSLATIISSITLILFPDQLSYKADLSTQVSNLSRRYFDLIFSVWLYTWTQAWNWQLLAGCPICLIHYYCCVRVRSVKTLDGVAGAYLINTEKFHEL